MAPKANVAKAVQQVPPGSSRSQRGASPAGKTFSEIRSFSPLGSPLSNLAMLELLDSGSIQPKLRVSQPGEPDELEADRVASQVMSAPAAARDTSSTFLPIFPRSTSKLHRKCSCSSGVSKCAACEEEEVEAAKGIHRKPSSDSSGTVSSAPGSVLQSLGSGRQLDPPLRKSMEARFGQDFGTVRVHDDSAAAQAAKAINAQAYTAENHIYFGAGSYAPHSNDGQRLLAHELVHVVQQRGGNATKTSATSHAPKSQSGGGSASRPSISSQPAGIQRLSLTGDLGTAYECAKASKRSAVSLLKLEVHSIAELLGIPKPPGNDPSVLDTILMVLKHPCLQLVPGYSLIAVQIAQIEKARAFLKGAYRIIQNPSIVIDPMKEAIGGMIAKIPATVQKYVNLLTAKAGATLKKLIEGIWRHLEPKLEYLGKNWWDVVKETGWNLLWPWPSVGKELTEIGSHIGACADNLWNLEISKSIDEFLVAWRGVNSIGGLLSGWFTIGAVLIGAILGGIFGVGAGAVPGAAAGFEVATSLGEGILVSTLAQESLVIDKALIELLATKQTQAQEEDNYEKISGSGLTLGITGAMMLLGAMVARFAKGIFGRVRGLFKKPPAVEPPKIQAPKVETPKVDAPKVQAPKTEAPKIEAPKTEAPPPEPPKAEASKPEARKNEGPKVESPKSEGPKSEGPKTESPKSETPESEPSEAETSAPEEEAVPEQSEPESPEPEPSEAPEEPKSTEPDKKADSPDTKKSKPKKESKPGKRARSAASKKGIKLRKKMAYERMKAGQYDPLQDLLTADERAAFMDSEGKELPKDLDWHHTRQTSADPGMADVPEHIQPTRHVEHMFGEHQGQPGNVPTAGIRGEVTSPSKPIYDPNAPEVQTGRYNANEPAAEGTLEDQGMTEGDMTKRKSPNFRDLPKVQDPALKAKFDYEMKGSDGIYRREISTGKWVKFPR
jgi:Domain of unknown function (DUF4157)